MMYVFFDVDGVLNREKDWKQNDSLNRGCVDAFGEICNRLESKYDGLRLVIISTWRKGMSKDGNSVNKTSLERELTRIGRRIYDQTPVSDRGRQAEVEYYIRRNQVEDYIVIDDDSSLFVNPERLNLFVPDYRTGLTSKDVNMVVKKARVK